MGQINAGRLPPISAPTILLKKDELAYLEVDAALLKDMAVRRTQAAIRA